MQNTNYLLMLCQRINQMGKKPSVALIRQYADRSLGIPEIVKALQNWKNAPPLNMDEKQQEEVITIEQSLEARVTSLENVVAKLTAQLESLQKA
ncbi:hypothetical protein [Paraglaciecola sp.]|uniref:hypothetical protein n=1 Tax=Paraglaciecola sp. TaxID=1920173 RepID=UPI0030F43F01